jgi:hypothetical protein
MRAHVFVSFMSYSYVVPSRRRADNGNAGGGNSFCSLRVEDTHYELPYPKIYRESNNYIEYLNFPRIRINNATACVVYSGVLLFPASLDD